MKTTGYTWHYHDEFEFLFIIEGKMDVCIYEKQYTLQKNNIFCISAMKPHHTLKYEAVKYFVLILPVTSYILSDIPYLYKYFLDDANNIAFYKNIQSNYAAQNDLRTLFLNLNDENSLRKIGYQIAVSSLIRQLLLLYIRAICLDEKDVESSDQYIYFKDVFKYIDDNIKNKIELNDLCRLVNYNYYYFSRKFKRLTGYTITDYILLHRLKKAECLLITTNLNIEIIAEETGFHNLTKFYKVFKKYTGITPSIFRKNISYI